MTDLWIIYSKAHDDPNSSSNRMLEEAIKHEINAELRFYDYFEIKDNNLYYKEELVTEYPKMVFFRCNHEEFTKFFETKGIRTVNNSYAIKHSTDKLLAHEVVKCVNAPQIKGELVKNLEYEDIISKYGKPFILKDRYGLQGNNIYLVKSKFKYNHIKKKIDKDNYLVQEYISESRGKDVRLYFCGDELIGAVLRKNDKSFLSNINKGGLSYDFKAPEDLIEIGRRIKDALQGEIISIDFVFHGDGFLFCEANTNAGFQSYAYLGYDVRNIFMTYLKKELEKLEK